jgi:hypothetical protein
MKLGRGNSRLDRALPAQFNILRRQDVKKTAILLAASFLATSAFAQSTTVIQRDAPAESRTVIKERVDNPTVVKKEVTTGSVGCSSKTVQKTDEFGDTKVKQKTEC